MKVKVDKAKFGRLLEEDIARAIKSTKLSKYTINNLVLQTSESWRQIDHIILLPHKTVIIEDKSSTCDLYKIYPNKDIHRFNRQDFDSSFNKSIVSQTSKYEVLLRGILADTESPFPMKIEVVGCIRAGRILSYQSNIPIHSDKTIWYYLKSLESELASFDSKLASELLTTRKQALKSFIRTEEQYIDFLKEKGVYESNEILVDTELLEPKDLTHNDDGAEVSKTQSKREQRLKDLESLLRDELKTVPPNYRSYALKYPTVSISSIVEHFAYLEGVQSEYYWFPSIIENSSHLINQTYIVDYCRKHNIFYSEFLLECIELFKELHNDMYKNILSGQFEVLKDGVDFKRVVDRIMGSTFNRRRMK